jgi:DNA-binding transcriptional MerR regulator
MTKKSEEYLMRKRNFLFTTAWFDHNFIGKFLFEDSEIKVSLNEKRFRLNKENISSRVITHWQELGLISDYRIEGKGWRKFSMTEMVWLHIVIRLRKFGMELSKIKRVKEDLDIYNSEDNQSRCPLLDFYIANSMVLSQPVCLLVFESGEAILARQYEIDISKQYGGINEDYISIDINKITRNWVKNKKEKTDYLDYSLTTIEKEVKRSLLFENVHSLLIKSKNGDEYLLDKEFIKSSKHEVDVLLNKLEYAEATTQKRGEKKIHKITEKKKIKRN